MRLETERLVLRELKDSDFAAVHAYASDPLVVRYMPWGPNSEADTKAFLARARAAAAVEPRAGYELAVTRRDDARLVGTIGLHQEEGGAVEAMLGYCFAREAWGKGYATEAGRAMLAFAFDELGLDCVWAGSDALNTGSIRVLEKLGMSPVSRHRHEPEGGGELDVSLMFRVRAREWPSVGGRTPEHRD